jgi:hypothetical protein
MWLSKSKTTSRVNVFLYFAPWPPSAKAHNAWTLSTRLTLSRTSQHLNATPVAVDSQEHPPLLGASRSCRNCTVGSPEHGYRADWMGRSPSEENERSYLRKCIFPYVILFFWFSCRSPRCFPLAGLFLSCSRRRSGRCINYPVGDRPANNPSHEAPVLEYRRRLSSYGIFPQDNSLNSRDFCSTFNTISTIVSDPLSLSEMEEQTTLSYHSIQVSLDSRSSTTCSICLHSADDTSVSSILWHNGRTILQSDLSEVIGYHLKLVWTALSILLTKKNVHHLGLTDEWPMRCIASAHGVRIDYGVRMKNG